MKLNKYEEALTTYLYDNGAHVFSESYYGDAVCTLSSSLTEEVTKEMEIPQEVLDNADDDVLDALIDKSLNAISLEVVVRVDEEAVARLKEILSKLKETSVGK